jgi:hypothetical protein
VAPIPATWPFVPSFPEESPIHYVMLRIDASSLAA